MSSSKPFAIALMFITACGGREERDRTRTPELPSVRVEPSDLMTSVRGSPVRITVGANGTPVTEELLKNVPNLIRVVSAGGEVVPMAVAFPAPTPDLPYGRFVELVATEELHSEWYKIWVDLRDSGMIADPSLKSESEGEFVSRFHPDSAPILQAVRFCPVADDFPATVVIDFSEPVDFVPNSAGLKETPPFKASIDGSSCELLMTVPDVGVEEDFSSHFEWKCGGVKEPELVTVTLVGVMHAASGQSAILSGDEASEERFQFKDSYDRGDGCYQWHMP